jgi:hypothetical protein
MEGKEAYHGVAQTAVSEGITRRAVDTEHGADFSSTNFGNFFHVVGVHAHNLWDSDFLI